jgi:hypothetical protein
MTDYRTQFDFFEVPNFQSLIPSEKLIQENKKTLTEYEIVMEEIDSEDSKTIIDYIFETNDINHQPIKLNPQLLTDAMKKIDFNKIQRYAFSMDIFESDIRYRHTYGNKFIDPFIKLGSFDAFKCAIDFILQNYSIDIVIFMLDYGILLDFKQRFCEPRNMFLEPVNSSLSFPCFEKFKEYFDYFESIGLFHSIVFLRDLFTLFSNRYLMFSNDFDCKKIFRYVLERVKPFKIFFSNIALYELPMDIEYFKLAYSYGLNVNSEILDKMLFNKHKNNLLNAHILKFLYSAGRDAMQDLLLLKIDSRVILYSLEENEPSDFICILNNLNIANNNEFSNNNESKLERIPYIDNYNCLTIEIKYSMYPKAVTSVNTILDFARLSHHFPERLRLTERFLQKIHSIHSKDFIQTVKKQLSPMLNDSILSIIMSY